MGGRLLRSKSMAQVVVMQSPPGWTMEICMLGCVVDAARVVFVRRIMDAVVLMKAVCSNYTGLAQPGSFKI
jgi:hypothetical protein